MKISDNIEEGMLNLQLLRYVDSTFPVSFCLKFSFKSVDISKI